MSCGNFFFNGRIHNTKVRIGCQDHCCKRAGEEGLRAGVVCDWCAATAVGVCGHVRDREDSGQVKNVRENFDFWPGMNSINLDLKGGSEKTASFQKGHPDHPEQHWSR